MLFRLSLSPPDRQCGAALILALLIVATVVTLVVALASDFLVPMKRTENTMFEQQARAYLYTTEGVARQILLLDLEADASQDSIFETWYTETLSYPTPQGLIAAKLNDLQARLNLNELDFVPNQQSQQQQQFSAQQQRFIRLLQLLPLAEPLTEAKAIALANAVFDWVDADDNERFPGGAESYIYSGSGLEPAVRPRNGPLTDISEIRWVQGMTAEIYMALKPYISVWPQRNSGPNPNAGGLNVNTADQTVLRTLNRPGVLQPLTESEAQLIWDERDNLAGFDGPAAFAKGGALAAFGIDTSGLGFKSSYFELTAQTDFLGRIYQLTSVLYRDERNKTMSLMARNQSR